MSSNFLFITDLCPTSDLTAGIALEKFIKELIPENEVFVFTILNPSLRNITLSSHIKNENSFWTYKPNEYWLATNLFFKLLSFVGNLSSAIETEIILRKIRKIAAVKKIDKLIFVLQGQTMFRICSKINMPNLPYFTITWDSWKWWALANNFPKSLLKRMQKSVSSTYLNGHHFFPTDQMAINNFVAKNHYSVFTLYSNVNLSNVQYLTTSRKVFRIGFSGQSYAATEINEFVNFLEQIRWNYLGTSIELHVFGRNSLNLNSHIYQHGWVSQEKLNSYLREMDCAFLPYPLDPNFKFISDESFPSKLSDYLGANLPIFYLGPSPCTASKFSQSCGVVANLSNFERVFLQFFQELVEDPEKYTSNIRDVYDSNFSKLAFRKSIQVLLPGDNSINSKVKEPSNPVNGVLLIDTVNCNLKIFPSLWAFSLISLFEEYLKSPSIFRGRVNSYFLTILRSVVRKVLLVFIAPYVTFKISRFWKISQDNLHG